MVVRGRVGRAAGLLLAGVLAVAGPGTGTAVSASVARADVVSWSAVSHLTPGVEGIYATDVVAHPDGSVTAMWIGPTWERRRVHVRHRPADGEWQASEVVTGTRDAYEARLGADGRGNLVLAWAANRRVMLARRAPGAAWSPAQVLHRTPGGERGTRPVGLALAVDERGHAALAWEERDDDLDALYVPPRVQMTVAGRGQVWRPVRTAAGQGWHPHVAVAGGGRATVAWLRREGRSGAGVVVSVHRPGHGWRTRGLTASGERAAGLRLTVSSAGAGVVWTYHRAGQWGVAARRWWPRKGWTAVRRTNALPAYGAWLAAGLDAAGRLTLTSARWDGPLRAVDLTRGGRWTAAERVGGPVRDTPVLVADPGGDVVVVWTDGRGDDSRLRAAVRPAGGSWMRRDLDPAGDPGVGPALAIDGRGRAVAVWSGGRDPERLQLHVREVVASAR